MDFRSNVVLKENYTFWVSDSEGTIAENEQGVYSYDTRYLNTYTWSFSRNLQTLVRHSSYPNKVHFHYAWIEGPSQMIGITRDIEIGSNCMLDVLHFENTDVEEHAITASLKFTSDFIDMFQARGFQKSIDRELHSRIDGKSARAEYTDAAGSTVSAVLSASCSANAEMQECSPGKFLFSVVLPAQATAEISIKLVLQSLQNDYQPSMDYSEWRTSFPASGEISNEIYRRVYKQSIDDLRALMLFTPDGPYPAAGIPWFVSAFGRDALITALLMLPHQQETSAGILRYLSRFQADSLDDFRAAEPGKIMHELRFGELSRMGLVPHTPYFGTIDATPLYLILLGKYVKLSGDVQLAKDLKKNWEAALAWMHEYGDRDGDGFLEYQSAEPGKGLVVQSWKDSDDSMMHADGSMAEGPIAPVEVQGYAYDAYCSAAELYEILGESEEAEIWRLRASDLKEKFHEAFWLQEKGIYAMALDGAKRPLAVESSNAGQLLYSGILQEETVPLLVGNLFRETLWSGWGIRTLGSAEIRYNPVSYHNGSVWPHDNAMIAAGLVRYGYSKEARQIAAAMYDLAAEQNDYRLPELVAGYARTEASPVPYPVACRPQAWDAAAIVFLLPLLE